MRILGYTVCKNEAHRYLFHNLFTMHGLLDDIALFDDQSTDESAEVASDWAKVLVRQNDTPSFMEHEGMFREAAWRWFEAALDPQPGDWVLAFDSDEFLVSANPRGVRSDMEFYCDQAANKGAEAIHIRIPEVFDADSPVGTNVMDFNSYLVRPKVRVDGYWGGIFGHRLFKYHPGGMYPNTAMGCGAEPSYVKDGPFFKAPSLFLMHYGYAHPEDRKAKHQRYTSLSKNGHASSHIRSILETPQLVEWEGPWMLVHRGLPGPF